MQPVSIPQPVLRFPYPTSTGIKYIKHAKNLLGLSYLLLAVVIVTKISFKYYIVLNLKGCIANGDKIQVFNKPCIFI